MMLRLHYSFFCTYNMIILPSLALLYNLPVPHQVHRPHHLRRNHGSRRGKEETPGRKDSWILLLNKIRKCNKLIFMSCLPSTASLVWWVYLFLLSLWKDSLIKTYFICWKNVTSSFYSNFVPHAPVHLSETVTCRYVTSGKEL